jgi:hypothetical protein
VRYHSDDAQSISPTHLILAWVLHFLWKAGDEGQGAEVVEARQMGQKLFVRQQL